MFYQGSRMMRLMDKKVWNDGVSDRSSFILIYFPQVSAESGINDQH